MLGCTSRPFVFADLPCDATGDRFKPSSRLFRRKTRSPAAISLTPQTSVNGALHPAKEVPNLRNFYNCLEQHGLELVLLVFIQVIFVTMVYGPIAALPRRSFPRENQVHVALSALSHRKWRLRRLLPLIGLT